MKVGRYRRTRSTHCREEGLRRETYAANCPPCEHERTLLQALLRSSLLVNHDTQERAQARRQARERRIVQRAVDGHGRVDRRRPSEEGKPRPRCSGLLDLCRLGFEKLDESRGVGGGFERVGVGGSVVAGEDGGDDGKNGLARRAVEVTRKGGNEEPDDVLDLRGFCRGCKGNEG